MEKTLLVAYLLLSFSVLLTAASWITWNNSCQDIYHLAREGDIYGGMCGGDGVQFVGIFAFAVVAATIYIGVTLLVLKVLGLKLTKK